MHILHINSEKEVGKVDQFVKKGYDVFILVYMDGCGPCNATRPEWAKIESALKDQYAKNNNLVIIDINKDYLSKIKHIGPIDGFPTMKYIGNNGKTVELYEKSSITKKDRTVSSFINWIETKINNTISTTQTSSPYHVFNRLKKTEKHVYKRPRPRYNKTKRQHKTKRHRGGKWSTKYKKSIDCSNPKGFSQKQHCKYGRK
jgi:thiol-disulfide isomerase/thioredoxin